MSTIRLFECNDLFKFNAHNLNSVTATNSPSFYLKLLVQYPEYCLAVDSPNGELIGYVNSKIVVKGCNRNGHVSMIAIHPDYQKLGIGTYLLTKLEDMFKDKNIAYVDLFSRAGNFNAIRLYRRLGYATTRKIHKMYANGDDALDMRKNILHM